MALGLQMVAHELHPTGHLNGSTTSTLPSGVGAKAPYVHNLRHFPHSSHSSAATVGNQGMRSRGWPCHVPYIVDRLRLAATCSLVSIFAAFA